MDNHTSLFAEAGSYPYNVAFHLFWLGKDAHVLVGGGTHPHIGAVAAAYWDGSGPVVWSNEFPHHKEGELAAKIVTALCRKLRTNVSVSIGIHVDHATRDEIVLLVRNCEQALEKLLRMLDESAIGE